MSGASHQKDTDISNLQVNPYSTFLTTSRKEEFLKQVRWNNLLGC